MFSKTNLKMLVNEISSFKDFISFHGGYYPTAFKSGENSSFVKIWNGINLRLGAIAVASSGQSLKQLDTTIGALFIFGAILWPTLLRLGRNNFLNQGLPPESKQTKIY